MATAYRYKHAGEEIGPVDFRELVRLVHEETIQADDLVIADWQKAWGPAAEVIGLFHTAGRSEVLEIWQREQNQKQRQALIDAGGTGGVDLDEIEKMLHAAGTLTNREKGIQLLEQAEFAERETLRQKHQRANFSGSGRENIEYAVESAISEIDDRELQRHKKSILSFLTVGTVQSIFRMCMAFGVANLMVYLVFSWSQTELQRFPERNADASVTRVFPLYGRCSEGEYLFLMLDTMIISGIAGYWIARGLEQLAEE